MEDETKEILKLQWDITALKEKINELEEKRIALKKEFEQLKRSMARLITILTGAGFSISFAIWFIEHFKDIKFIFHL